MPLCDFVWISDRRWQAGRSGNDSPRGLVRATMYALGHGHQVVKLCVAFSQRHRLSKSHQRRKIRVVRLFLIESLQMMRASDVTDALRPAQVDRQDLQQHCVKILTFES